MPHADSSLDFGVLLPHVHVFGGVRRFLEIGNVLVARGHRFVLYHTDGAPPTWMEYRGEVQPLAALASQRHAVLLTASPELIEPFAAATARLKLFYCVHKNLPGGAIARQRSWTLLANSSALGQRLWRRYRVHAEPAIGGVDIRRFQPRQAPRAAPEPFRILVFGRWARAGKGADLAVRAVEGLATALRHRAPAWAGTLAHPVQLVLFDHAVPGGGESPASQLQFPVPHEFHWNQTQDELARLYASCDLFLSAERRAGWNNTVAEAMASGVPVVCTRAGTGDLAVHGETALVVRLRHPFFFRRALLALCRDKALRERLARQGRAQAERYSWEHVADRIEAVSRARLASAGA